MIVLAIDPGTHQSSFVMWDGQHIGDKGIMPNAELLRMLRMNDADKYSLVIEQIKSYGQPVGQETFDTVFWSGRFAEAYTERGGYFHQAPRLDVKLHFCHSARARDSHIWQALVDRFGSSGTKKNRLRLASRLEVPRARGVCSGGVLDG